MSDQVICQRCGSVNDYRTILKSNQLTAWCNGCDHFIKNIPQGKEPQLYFGKYKGRLISSLTHPDEIKYLEWVLLQPFCKNGVKKLITEHLFDLKTAPFGFNKSDQYTAPKCPAEGQIESQNSPFDNI